MEEALYERNPSMFRNHPFWFSLYVLLSLVGVGLVLLGIWWLKCKSTKLTITSVRTILRRGLLSKSTNEVLHMNVRNVQVDQTFMQRILDTGTIGISSAGQSEVEILVRGMPDPDDIRDLIDKHRKFED